MWTTFLEEEEQQISNTVTEGKELSYTYKNYIYRDKNWEYPVCNANDDHCEHYHCTLCKRIHPKDRAYKIRLSQQYKYLELNDSNSKEGEDVY